MCRPTAAKGRGTKLRSLGKARGAGSCKGSGATGSQGAAPIISLLLRTPFPWCPAAPLPPGATPSLIERSRLQGTDKSQTERQVMGLFCEGEAVCQRV
ncbi:hypothetical protein SKAU_G00338090 [Synaphobranchus kaupii]|uniref:Uncharacterized protein n=1 Tax=Synaphobranchus kaupii TaxID=118154 RepID=A0A9Q1IGZ3_SYNKA|nr:hypothetical protein SKAU_G00338090 [Synaphobranchus kaupii]